MRRKIEVCFFSSRGNSYHRNHRKNNGHARSVSALCTLAIALLFAAPVFAQLGPSAAQSQGSQAVQLPLSGRTAQGSGTVKTSDQPAPSTTATVNTLNPNVQIQGNYQGSTPGISSKPFNGKLTLRDAIARGLAYNLGETGATQAFRQTEGQGKVARSALLPNINGTATENVQT